jgi:hypothetical protein
VKKVTMLRLPRDAGLSAQGFCVAVLLVFGCTRSVQLSAGASQPAMRSVRQQDICTETAGRDPLVTVDSIGILNVHRTIAELRRLCPSARDTVTEGEETLNPGIVFHLGSVTLIASQIIGRSGDSLASALPANFWRVIGSRARLPLGLTLASRWSDLHAAYGPGVAHWEAGGVVVQFCRFPRFEFLLNYGSGPGGAPDDLASIPGGVRIWEVWMITEPNVERSCIRRSSDQG